MFEQILKYLKQKAVKANVAKQHELPLEQALPLTPACSTEDLKASSEHCQLQHGAVGQHTTSELSISDFTANTNLISAT